MFNLIGEALPAGAKILSSRFSIGHVLVKWRQNCSPLVSGKNLTSYLLNFVPKRLNLTLRAILLKRFGPSILQDKPGTTINDAPGLYDFWIPFFAESPLQD